MADILNEEGMELEVPVEVPVEATPIEITPAVIEKNTKVGNIIKDRVNAYKYLQTLIEERTLCVQEYNEKILKAEADLKKLDNDAVVEYEK